jgi:hypothetical protein
LGLNSGKAIWLIYTSIFPSPILEDLRGITFIAMTGILIDLGF